MSTPSTITLPRAAFDSLREGRVTVRIADSTGRRVALFAKQVWPSTRQPACQPSIILGAADLDLIEQQPEGLVVTGTAGVIGWTVQVAR